eukprot:3938692-Rhodomonas_salina.2
MKAVKTGSLLFLHPSNIFEKHVKGYFPCKTLPLWYSSVLHTVPQKRNVLILLCPGLEVVHPET